MKRVLSFIVLLISISVFSQTSITKNIGDFDNLKIFNGIEVELIKSDEQKVIITRKKAEKVRIKNVNNTLKFSLPFSLKPKENSANGEVLIKLFYNNSINIIDVNEGALLTGKDIKQDVIEIKTQERALVNLVINVNHLKAKTSSGGIIKLSGTTKTQEVDADLYGEYLTYNLKTEQSAIVRAGSGAKVEIHAGKKLNAKVTFGGSIFYKGNPEVVKDKKVVAGIIQKREE